MTETETMRNTEPAKLPDGWRWVRLGEMCEFGYGSSLPEIGRNKGTIPVYGSNGVVGYHDEPVSQGPTLIIGRKGSIGEVNYSSGPCWPIDTTYYVDSSKTSCDLRWLFFLLKFIKLNALNKASGVPGLNRNDAYDQLIPFPPTITEQERIACILNEQMAVVEKARAAGEARLQAAKSLRAAYLRQVFPKTNQELPPGWRRVRLRDVSSIISKGTTPTTLGFSYVKNGIPFLRAQDIKGTPVNIAEVAFAISPDADEALCRSRLLPCDFLITIAGTIGRVGYVPKDAPPLNCNQAVAFARLDSQKIDVTYLAFACQNELVISPLLNSKAGGALQNLNLQQINDLEIPLPPLTEQKQIAALLDKQMESVGKIVQTIQEELDTINTIPAALLRRAFGGGL